MQINGIHIQLNIVSPKMESHHDANFVVTGGSRGFYVMKPSLSSLVVILALTSSVTSDDKIGLITILGFRYSRDGFFLCPRMTVLTAIRSHFLRLSGTRFTRDSSIIILIQLKIHFAVIQILLNLSPQILHLTKQLYCHDLCKKS